MGQLTIPKHTSDVEEIKQAMKIYYEYNDWMINSDYILKLKGVLGDKQYPSSYNKKAQVPLYFGFITSENDSNRARKKITNLGKYFFESLTQGYSDGINEAFVWSLYYLSFGRKNYGSPSSDSDIDPPSLLVRTILDLSYVHNREFVYLLQQINDEGKGYTDTINQIRKFREDNNTHNYREAPNRYTDLKPIKFMIKCGFFQEVEGNISLNKKVKNKHFNKLKKLKVYNIDKEFVNPLNIDIPSSTNRVKGGENLLLYGVPGSGKSYAVNSYYNNEDTMERVVFHHDYTYSDFVGQILPKLTDNGSGDKKLSYVYVPGPLTKILRKAELEPQKMYYLVIEEINRGNAPAIFGDFFQLLDRDIDGGSVYGISNYDVSQEVYKNENKKVYFPSNLSIIATMNTSDQNIFTLDTAFQRRWKMKNIENDVTKAKHAKVRILDSDITWEMFNKKINEYILKNSVGMISSEDKRLGAYFVSREELIYDSRINSPNPEEREEAYIQNKKFPEKVLKYLWDDAFKYNRQLIFKEEFISLEEMIKAFESESGNNKFNVFNITFS